MGDGLISTYNTLTNHRDIAWLLIVLFWLVILFNVAEHREVRMKTPNVECQDFLQEYCGIKAFMGKPFNICGKSGRGLNGDLLPLILSVAILLYWLTWEVGKIASSIILLQTFTIAKTNFTNDHYLISLIFFYATFSLLLYIIFHKNKKTKNIYTE